MRAIATLTLAMAAAAATAQTGDRGRLLYETHCIQCHTTQMHWREQRLARDWDTLRGQVVRWQAAATLDWDPDDIEAVTRFLNDTIYRFPRAQAHRDGGAAPRPGQAARGDSSGGRSGGAPFMPATAAAKVSSSAA